jgi:glycosyltransferase involved in cell wall biosynthesis
MRVGVDARPAAEVPGGRGSYVRELLRALATLDSGHEFVLFARRRWEDLGARFRWRLLGGREPLWNLRAARAASVERCDVYLTTDSYSTAWFLRVPSVLMLHDLIAFDPARVPNRRDSVIQRVTLPLALRRAAAAVCPSAATAHDLAKRFPGRRADVVPLAAGARFDSNGPARSGGYVLAVGTLEPRKNLPRLIEAYAGLPEPVRAGRPLLLAGAVGWDEKETLAAVAAHDGLVRRLGYVPDAELPALYRGADLVCYVSLYEGFGLPVLEAMSCGAAVLTADTSALAEVGGDAVRYVDPLDVDSIRAGLAALLADPSGRAELGRRATERAREFSWRTTAERTLAVLERAAAAGG